MKWFRDLFPRQIKQYQSPINGMIEVVMALNKPRLMIGGMIQSGGLVRAIWEKALKNLKENQKKIDKATKLMSGIMETLEILSDPKMMQAIEESQEDIKAGRVKELCSLLK